MNEKVTPIMHMDRLNPVALKKYQMLVKDCNVTFPIGMYQALRWRGIGKSIANQFLDAGLIRYNDEDKKDAADQAEKHLKIVAMHQQRLDNAKANLQKCIDIIHGKHD